MNGTLFNYREYNYFPKLIDYEMKNAKAFRFLTTYLERAYNLCFTISQIMMKRVLTIERSVDLLEYKMSAFKSYNSCKILIISQT